MAISFVEKDEPFDLYLVWVEGVEHPFNIELPVGETPADEAPASNRIEGHPVIRFEFQGTCF